MRKTDGWSTGCAEPKFSLATTLCVSETFASIQGESTWAGLPCFFIRLAGCNLACRYCDTAESRVPGAGQDLTVGELTGRVVAARLPLVEVTGGEPLLQAGTPELCLALLAGGFTVLLETNGSLALDDLPAAVIRIMDVKGPGSGAAASLREANFAQLRAQDEVKFVIGDRADYDYAGAMLRKHDLAKRTARLLFSPVWGQLDPAELAAWIMADRLPVRLQLQLHKLLWGPDRHGV